MTKSMQRIFFADSIWTYDVDRTSKANVRTSKSML